MREEDARGREAGAPLDLKMPLENGRADERVSRGQASERAVCVCEAVSVEMGARRPPLPTAVVCPPGRRRRLRLAITAVGQPPLSSPPQRERERERCLYLDKLIGVPICLRFRISSSLLIPYPSPPIVSALRTLCIPSILTVILRDFVIRGVGSGQQKTELFGTCTPVLVPGF